MVDVVQQVEVIPEPVAYGLEQAGDEVEVPGGRPGLLVWLGTRGRGLVEVASAADTVDLLHAGHADLDANGAVAAVEEPLDRVEHLGYRGAVRVSVHLDGTARSAADQLVDG